MATISDRSAVRRILETNGQCDLAPISIVYRFSDIFGEDQFAIFTSPDHDDLGGCDTHYCSNVVCFMANNMLTPEGQAWLSWQKQVEQMEN